MQKKTRVKAMLGEGFRVEAQAKNHRIVMDLPPPFGGGAGPTPVDLLLASLAGCYGIVSKYHASKHGIEIRGMNVIIEAEYDPAGFEGEDVKPGLQKVSIIVEVDTPNSEEEIKEFMKFVSQHCPIEDTLRSQTPVTTVVKKK